MIETSLRALLLAMPMLSLAACTAPEGAAADGRLAARVNGTAITVQALGAQRGGAHGPGKALGKRHESGSSISPQCIARGALTPDEATKGRFHPTKRSGLTGSSTTVKSRTSTFGSSGRDARLMK